MEATSTTSSAASSVDGRSVGGGGSEGGYLNLGMFTGSGGISAGNATQQLQHQQANDLLIGSSSGGYSLSNGFGNLSSDTGLGGVGGGGGSSGVGTSFDLNDFPTLGGGGGSSSLGNNSAVGGGISTGSGSGLAAALRQQQQILAAQQQQQQQQQQLMNNTGSTNGAKIPGGGGGNLYRLAMTNSNGGNFSIASEDFPALSGGPVQSGGGSSGLGSNVILNSSSLLSGTSNTASSIQRTNANGDGLYGGGSSALDSAATHLDSGTSLLSGGVLSGLGGLRGLQQQQQQQQQSQQQSNSFNPSNLRAPSSSAPSGTIGSSIGPPQGGGGGAGGGGGGVSNAPAGAGSTAGTALSGDYGLLGLLSVIRMTDADRNALALGSDLTLLGLNLASTEQIYSTFSSPWSDVVATKEPHYQLPMCYYMQPPALKTGHLSKFQVETLFYIFYALPKDVLQAYAAQELYTREWRYHVDLKLWFKRASPSDGVIAPNSNTSSSSNNPQQYLYFDINTWERRLFNGNMNQNITNGFLSEEEIRVKL